MKSIRERWDDIVRTRFDGNYEAADLAFHPDPESRQEQIVREMPDEE